VKRGVGARKMRARWWLWWRRRDLEVITSHHIVNIAPTYTSHHAYTSHLP